MARRFNYIVGNKDYEAAQLFKVDQPGDPLPIGSLDYIFHSYVGAGNVLRFILAGMITDPIGPEQVEYRLYAMDPATQKIRCIENYKPDGIPLANK
jgi:hypothetical protein